MLLSKDLKFRQNTEVIFKQKIFNFQDLILSNPLQPCWFYPVADKTLRNIASDNESYLFLSFSNGEVDAINSEFGELLWKTNLGGKIVSNILADSNNIFLTTTNNTENEIKIRSLIKTTGITNWETKLPTSLKSEDAYLLEYSGDVILVDKQGNFFRINKKGGRIIWQAKLNTQISTKPRIIFDSIIFGTLDKQIISFSLSEKGKIAKMKAISSPTVLFANDVEQNVVWGDAKGFLNSAHFPFRSKKNFKKNWKFRNGGEVSQIVDTTEGLLITSFDNFVYLISKTNGELIWKRRFGGRIIFKPLIYGNFAIINVIGEPSAFVVEVSDGKIINKISIESNDFLTDSALKSNNKIVFPTSKGLISFSQKGCNETNLN